MWSKLYYSMLKKCVHVVNLHKCILMKHGYIRIKWLTECKPIRWIFIEVYAEYREWIESGVRIILRKKWLIKQKIKYRGGMNVIRMDGHK